MLTGEGAAQFERKVKELIHRCLDSLHLFSVPRITHERHMQVAIARMSKGIYVNLMLL